MAVAMRQAQLYIWRQDHCYLVIEMFQKIEKCLFYYRKTGRGTVNKRPLQNLNAVFDGISTRLLWIFQGKLPIRYVKNVESLVWICLISNLKKSEFENNNGMRQMSLFAY